VEKEVLPGGGGCPEGHPTASSFFKIILLACEQPQRLFIFFIFL